MLPRRIQPLAIAAGLSLGLAISNGLGLYAYGLILPSMLYELGWTYSDAGWINSAAGLGYLIGALLAFGPLRKMPPARMFQLGLIASAAALIATGATRELAQLAFVRVAAGIAAAAVMISGTMLTNAIYVHEPDRARTANAIFLGGIGIGLMISGALLPALFRAMGAKAWPEAWLTLGLLASVTMPFAFWASQRVAVVRSALPPVDWHWQRYLPAFTAYACFAAGNIVVMTFLIAWAREQGANVYAIVAVWSTLGLAGLLAPAFWRPMLAQLSCGQRLAAPAGLAALGGAIALVGGGGVPLVVAAAMFGFGAFMVPVAMTDLSRGSLPRAAWGPALCAFTLVSAAAQMLMPGFAGMLADEAQSLQAGLGLGVGTLTLGALVALAQRPAADAVTQGPRASLAP